METVRQGGHDTSEDIINVLLNEGSPVALREISNAEAERRTGARNCPRNDPLSGHWLDH